MKAVGLVGLAWLALVLNGCFPPAPDEGVCGDDDVNIVAGEECDDGSENSDAPDAACRTNCLPQRCGDGVTDTYEQCDLGAENSDSVESSCSLECRLMRCGDGIVEPGEACDDGYNDACGACNDTCTAPGTDTMGACGDGTLCEEAGETCDDGNATNEGNGCDGACQRYDVCGNGMLESLFETCDDGNIADGDGCESTCMLFKWQSFTTANTGGGLASNRVHGIAIDSVGGKWFGTVGGVSHLSADNTTWTTFTTDNTGGGLVGDWVAAIAIDSAGGKWFGTYDVHTSTGGVSHLSADNTTWTTFTKANTDGGLADNHVGPIAIDSAGGKWVGTYDPTSDRSGVSHLSADNTTWTTYTYANTDGGLVKDYVEAIAIDSAGGKWFGAYDWDDDHDGGVSHLSADNTTWTTYTYANTDGGLVDDFVNAIAIDSAGGKWFGTRWGDGVSHLSADNTTWTTYANTDGGLVRGFVNAIAIDSAGGKWFGTWGDGVSHLSADNTTWTRFTPDNTDGGLADNYVYAIAIDSAGGKWVGTNAGVSYWTAAFGM